MQEPEGEAAGWTAELAPADTVQLSHGADRFSLSRAEAMRTGLALLAASVVSNSPARRPPLGTRIENCHFPVLAWTTGRSAANGEPVLLLTIPGGQVLVFQLTGPAAETCGRALVREAEAGKLPSGSRPN